MKDKILKNLNSAIAFLREEKRRTENLIFKIRNLFYLFFSARKQKRIIKKDIIKAVVFLLAMFFLFQVSCNPDEKNVHLSSAGASWYAAGETQSYGSGQASHYALSKVTASETMDHLALAGSSSQVAGVSQIVTITAISSSGDVYTAYTGDKTITFSGANSVGSYSPACTDKNGTAVPFGTGTVLTFTNGVATAELKLYKAEKANITFTDGAYSGSFQIDAYAQALSNFNISAPSVVYGNVPFSMTITARDPYGNPAGDGNNASSLFVSRGTITPASISGGSFYCGLGPDGKDYGFKRSISITNNVSENLIFYQAKLILDTASLISAGKMQTDCGDIRFAEADGTNIPYWIEEGCNTSSTVIWIKTNLDASATKTIYAYYGNASVDSESNGNNIFEFFDEFNGTALDTTKWTTGYFVEENNGPFGSRNTGYDTPNVSGGNLVFSGKRSSADYEYENGVASGWWGRSVISKSDIARQNFIIESRIKFSQSSSGTYANQYASHVLGVGMNANELVFGRYIYNNTISIKREVYGTITSNTPTAYAYDGSVWKKAKLTFINNGAVYYQVDNSDVNEYSVGEDITARKISISFYHRAPRASVVQNVDWILVRQYVAVEPAVIAGSEISTDGIFAGTFTIDADTTGNDVITVTNDSINATATVYVDIMDHLALAGSSMQTAGASQAITIMAIGSSGDVYTAYTGDKTITFSGANSVGSYSPACTDKNGTAVPFGTGTVLTFTNGVAVCNLQLYENETAAINATDSIYTAVGHNLFIVVSSDINTFGASAPATAAAGTSVFMTLTAWDSYGNNATAYTGDKTITFSGANSVGSYSPACTDKNGTAVPFGTGTVLTFTNGVATAELKLYKAEKANITFTDGAYSGSFLVKVLSQNLSYFNIDVPASTKSGTPFVMAIAPYDYYGNSAVISGDTLISVNHGTINGISIPDSSFKIYTGPDGKDYGFKRSISITNNVSENLIFYQAKLILDTASLISAGKMQTDCGDIRFAEADGTNIPYWIEEGCNTSSTVIWIKTNLDASATKTIYAYYGNASVDSESNASGVFIFYDDFENGLDKWTGVKGSIYTDNGDNVLRLKGGAENYAETLVLPDYQNIIVESKFKFNAFGPYGPRLSQDANPIHTMIESRADGSNSLWHQTWLGTSSNTQIARSAPSWSTKKDYFSKLTLTNSLQRWEVGATVLSGTYVRPDVVSGKKLAYWTWDSGNDLWIYWVKIRQYAAMDPTVAVGTEMHGDGTYRGEFIISGILQDTNVTVTVLNGSIMGAADILVEAADHMNHFKIEGANSQSAGSSQTVTITAIGESGDVYTIYEGDYNLIFSGAGSMGDYVPSCNDVSFGAAVPLSFTDGVATCDLKLYKAEFAVLAVSDGKYNSAGNSLSVEVLPAALGNFDLAMPVSAVSETAFSMSIGLRDAYGNTVVAIPNDVSISVNQGNISPGTVAVSGFADGAYAGSFTISQIYADADVDITFSSGDAVKTQSIAVKGIDHMGSLLLNAGNQTAGSPQNITITAIGLSGNAYASYTGEKSVFFSGASAINGHVPSVNDIPFGNATTVEFVNGSATAAMTLYRAGAFSIAVAEGAYSGLRKITVISAPLSDFNFMSPAVVTCGTSFEATLTALDTYGNITNNVPVDVGVGVSSGSVYPPSIPRDNFLDDGIYYSRHFNISAVYADTDVTITFQSASVTRTWIIKVLGVDRMDHFLITGSASQTAGEIQTVTIAAILDSGNIDTSYGGNRTITFSGASAINGHVPSVNDIPFGNATTVEFVNGSATAAMKLYRAGAVSVNATDGSYDANEHALNVNVAPAAFNGFTASAFAPVSSDAAFSMTVFADDAYGNATTQVSEDVSIDISNGSISPALLPAASFAANGSYTGSFTISNIPNNITAILTFQSGSITDTQSMAVIGTDTIDHFRMEGSGIQVAGEAQTVTVTAIAVSGRVDVDYEGSYNLVFSGASAINSYAPTANGIAFGASTPLIFTRGIATCDIVLYKARTSTINISDGAHDASGNALTVTTIAAPAAAFYVTAPRTAVSGMAFSVSLKGRDAYTNITSSVAEDIRLAVDQGTVSPAIIAKTSFQDGIYSDNFTINGITAPTAIVLNFTSGSIEITRNITVYQEDKMDHLRLDASSSQVAGASQRVAVVAVGLSGSVYANYAGEKVLTFSGAGSVGDYYPTAARSPFCVPVALTFTAGTAYMDLKLYKAETAVIAATDGTYEMEAAEIAVRCARLNHFAITAPATAISGTPFPLAIYALDLYGNAVIDISADTMLTVNHGTVSPASVPAYEFTDDGIYTGDTAIAHIIQDTTVALTVQNGTITQTADIEVIGIDVMDHFTVTTGGQDIVSQTAGTPLPIAVTAIGESGNVYTSYTGSRLLNISGAAVIGAYVPSCTDERGIEVPFSDPIMLYFVDGIAACDLRLYKTGAADIAAMDGNYNSIGHNLKVSVSSGDIYSFAGAVPTVAVSGMPFVFDLTAKDRYGNTTSVLGDTLLSVNSGTVTPSISAASFQDGSYIGNIAISGIAADSNVTLNVANGSVVQTASLLVTGVDLADHLQLSLPEAGNEVFAGVPVRVDIAIVKADGSIYTDYTGIKDITFSGAEPLLSYIPYFTDRENSHIAFASGGILSFVNGIASTYVTLFGAGEAILQASDGFHNTQSDSSYGLSLQVLPGAASEFNVDIPVSVETEVSFPLALAAKDEFGNITTNVSGDVSLSVNSGAIDTPSVPAAGFAADGNYIANVAVFDIARDEDVILTFTSGSISQSVHIFVTAKKESPGSGGASFILPQKPDISKTWLVLSEGRLSLINMPFLAVEIAVSDSSAFPGSSWKNISLAGNILNYYSDSPKIYVKFRGKKGGVSDVLVYSRTALAPAGIALRDGDIVKTEDNFDVYIIKLINGKQFRRLILSPHVFNSYHHLKWENIKVISFSRMNSFAISALAQVAGDTDIYELFPAGDKGGRKKISNSRFYDPDSVYEINAADRDSYILAE